MPSAATDPAPRYERFCRGWWGLNGRGVLWLGPDHLLHSASVLAVERYQRWYFREVQALVARRTAVRTVLNLIAGGFALLLTFGASTALVVGFEANAADARVGLFILAGILGVVALAGFALVAWNTLLGPTCTVRIVTPRGTERLPGLMRLPVFERLVARLGPLTAAVAAADEAPHPAAGASASVA